MTIDERAAAATAEINVAESNEPSDYYDGLVQEIIARHLREAVAERDSLLNKCRKLSSLGIATMAYTFRKEEDKAREECAKIEEIQAEITAMIGEQT